MCCDYAWLGAGREERPFKTARTSANDESATESELIEKGQTIYT